MTGKYVGKAVTRLDGLDLVTGRAKFSRDFTLPGMLHAKTVRSPHPHARVLRICTDKVFSLGSPVVVATARDIRGINRFGSPIADQPVLVAEGETVKLVGDPVALVAAETEEAALQAAKLVEVEYELLDAVTDPEVACLDTAPLIHKSRFCGEYEYKRGDVEKGFNEADVVVERVFLTPRQEHAFIEPEGGVAYLEPDGTVVIYAALQDPFTVRAMVARALGIKEHKVRAIIPPIGGAFGGKQTISIHIHAALLATMTGRPVRLVWTREESFLMHPKRHPSRIKGKIGLRRDGRITAYSADILFDAGAYAAQSPGVIYWAGQHAAGPYYIPNLHISGRAVYTNNPISGAFRGFGAPQAVTALERILDVAAKEIGMDAAEVRRRNALVQGQEPGLREVVLDGRVTLIDTIDRALEVAGPPPSQQTESKKVGRGIACAMPQFDVSAEPIQDLRGTGAVVEMFRDGTAQVRIGVVEMGTGITTVLRQIVAEELSIPIDDVSIIFGDSQLAPKSGPTVASRSVYTCGNAVRSACKALRQRLVEKASEIFGVKSHLIRLEDGFVYIKDQKESGIRIADLADRAFYEGVNLTSNVWFVGEHAGAGHTFVTTIADVEVDTGTGEVRVLKLVICHDAGRALNPLNLRAQLLGGATQSLGWAVMEDMITDGGKLMTPSLAEYYVPTSMDIPDEMQVVVVEEPYPTGPYGAKGAGEFGCFTTAASVLNAVANALGIEFYKFPVTPDRVWEELNKDLLELRQ